MDFTSPMLRWLLLRSPLLLLSVVGILIAIIRWKRHPKVSLLTILGLCFWQLESFTFLFVRYRLPEWSRANGWTTARLTSAYFAIGLTQDFFYAVMLILLVAAAFSQRGNRLTVNN